MKIGLSKRLLVVALFFFVTLMIFKTYKQPKPLETIRPNYAYDLPLSEQNIENDRQVPEEKEFVSASNIHLVVLMKNIPFILNKILGNKSSDITTRVIRNVSGSITWSTTANDLPTIYVITPTYPRVEQLPDMTRLAQTLMLVPKVFWIVVEDAEEPTVEISALLSRTSMPHVHLIGIMPESYRGYDYAPKGVANRLVGLKWIRKHGEDGGVFYFADDDNTYDIRLFEEIRSTKRISMFPVGSFHFGVSTPIVREKKIVGFYEGWWSNRTFMTDMAGFAVNVGFFKSRPDATMPFRRGHEEDGFLKSLNFTYDEIELKADNCKQVLVWHTQTVKVEVLHPMSAENLKKYNDTNLPFLPGIVKN